VVVAVIGDLLFRYVVANALVVSGTILASMSVGIGLGWWLRGSGKPAGQVPAPDRDPEYAVGSAQVGGS
jgi:hypothetical protein